MEAFASRLEAIAISNKKLLDLLVARTLLVSSDMIDMLGGNPEVVCHQTDPDSWRLLRQWHELQELVRWIEAGQQ